MTELKYLQEELRLAEADGGSPLWDKIRFYFYTAAKPYLEAAWEEVKKEGWKTDWQRAAKHFLITFACRDTFQFEVGYIVHDSREVTNDALHIIGRWLNGLQGIWTSEEVDPVTQEVNKRLRNAEVVALLTRDYAEAIWLRADEYRIAHDRKFHRRERAMTMPAETEELIAEVFDL